MSLIRPFSYVPMLGGSYFLDGRSDVAAAYSLRLLKSTYDGPLVRVRRSSDSTEQDFGTSLPAVNWSAVLAFIGAGNGFVTKWYDQSGNTRDFAQATAANQPQINLLSNSLPGLVADGSNDFMTTTAFAISQPTSFNVVYRRVTNAQTDIENLFSSSGADANTLYRDNNQPSSNSLWSGATFHSNNTAQPTGTRGAVGGCFNGASSLMEVNASTISSFTGNPSTTGLNGLTLFTDFAQTATRFDNSEVQELIVFNAAHNSTLLKSDNALMRTAWGF